MVEDRKGQVKSQGQGQGKGKAKGQGQGQGQGHQQGTRKDSMTKRKYYLVLCPTSMKPEVHP